VLCRRCSNLVNLALVLPIFHYRRSVPLCLPPLPRLNKATLPHASPRLSSTVFCGHIGNPQESFIDEIQESVALLWTNTSNHAVNKRSWGPSDIFGDATNQIPPGEYGMIYVAYQEGTREQIADLRTQKFLQRAHEWSHPASIRIPISFLIRLYPRPMYEGQPDLIESTVCLISGVYGDPALASDFPATVFT